ncbi:hypothetical protein Tco_1424862, partial [Tanacetum coccineum]
VPKSMEHDSPDASATSHLITEPESVQLVPEENHAPPAMLQFAKTRKLSAERSDPRLSENARGGRRRHMIMVCAEGCVMDENQGGCAGERG